MRWETGGDCVGYPGRQVPVRRRVWFLSVRAFGPGSLGDVDILGGCRRCLTWGFSWGGTNWFSDIGVGWLRGGLCGRRGFKVFEWNSRSSGMFHQFRWRRRFRREGGFDSTLRCEVEGNKLEFVGLDAVVVTGNGEPFPHPLVDEQDFVGAVFLVSNVNGFRAAEPNTGFTVAPDCIPVPIPPLNEGPCFAVYVDAKENAPIVPQAPFPGGPDESNTPRIASTVLLGVPCANVLP